MTLRNKIAKVLDANASKCLDDAEDREAVLDALEEAFRGPFPLIFAHTCEEARWVVELAPDTAQGALIQKLLRALGEA